MSERLAGKEGSGGQRQGFCMVVSVVDQDLNNEEVKGTVMGVEPAIGVEAGLKSRKGRDINFSKAACVGD